MRLLIDTLIALMFVGILAAVLVHYRRGLGPVADLGTVHEALAQLHEQAAYQAALGIVDRSDAGYPERMSPEWFEGSLPVNPLIQPKQPWIDIAPRGDRSDQPPDPVILRPEQAGFWYNPARGVFRARVMPEMTDALTLEVYNRVNGTSLAEFPRPDPDRTPVPQPIPETATATVQRAVEFTSQVDDPAPTARPTLSNLTASGG